MLLWCARYGQSARVRHHRTGVLPMTLLTPEIHSESVIDMGGAFKRYMMYLRIGAENVIAR